MSAPPPKRPAILAVDLGGTRMRVAVFGLDGVLRTKSVSPTPPDRPQALPEAMREAIAAGGAEIGLAVVGVPGPVDYVRGEPLRLPNLPAWEGRLSGRGLADALRLPVIFANDADLAAVGEHRFGAGIGTSDMLYVTASTGVGAGVIIDGRLLHGRRSLAEAGHMVIDRRSGGTMESLGSGTALARLAGEDAALVAQRVRAGDARAREHFLDVADALAIGILNLVYCFMPERVVIGGGLAQAGELLLAPVREYVARHGDSSVSGADIVPAQGGDDVGLLGAFAIGLQSLTDDGARADLVPIQPGA